VRFTIERTNDSIETTASPDGAKAARSGTLAGDRARYALDLAKLQLLRELCRTVDRIDELDRVIAED
jgi:hypothetical protein